jgi:hypothetical protein
MPKGVSFTVQLMICRRLAEVAVLRNAACFGEVLAQRFLRWKTSNNIPTMFTVWRFDPRSFHWRQAL